MSAQDVVDSAKYFREQAAADQGLIDRAKVTPGARLDGLEDLERRRDLWIQLADETEGYLGDRSAKLAELESTPPPCSEALF